jgi:HSP20 family protein
MNGLITRRWFGEPRSLLRNLGSLQREMDSLFDGLVGDLPQVQTADWSPRVETYLKDEALHVRADLPGVDPSKVDVTLEDDVLTIRGERQATHEEAAYREVSYGRFERSLRVPEGVEPDKIGATFDKGVLHVTVPVPKPVERKVRIAIGGEKTPPKAA